jgi:16S rRNA G527 N7-methylase RsmG
MTNLNKETMKRPSEYMTMTDGVTQHDYKQALNKYIDYLEAENKQLILSGVSHQRELLLKSQGDYLMLNTKLSVEEIVDFIEVYKNF